MPVVTIALNGKFDGGKCNVYPEWNNWILALRQKTCGFECGDHGYFNTANSRHGFLRQEGIATLRTRSESGYQRRLYLANFTAHLTRHFDLWLIQRMVFAHYGFGFVSRRAKYRAASSFVIRGNRKMFAALRAYLVNAWQSSGGRLISAIRTFPRAISTIEVGALLNVYLSAFYTRSRWVIVPPANVTAIATAKALLAARRYKCNTAMLAGLRRFLLLIQPFALVNIATSANDTAIVARISFVKLICEFFTA